MKTLIAIFMLVFTCRAEEYATACRAPFNMDVESAAMPVSLWTNTVLWLTAESPVLNAGTTNANWLCYAKTCAGNAVQTTLNSQPSMVFTNGVWALNFDGADDYITTDLTSSSFDSQWTLAAWIRHSGGNTSSRRLIIHKPGSAQNQDRGSLSIITTNVSLTAGLVAITTNVIGVADGEIAFVCATYNRTGPVLGHYKNGKPVFLGTPDTNVPTGSGEKVNIGCFNRVSPANIYNGEIFATYIFPTALTTNQVLRLYNATKGAYGL